MENITPEDIALMKQAIAAYEGQNGSAPADHPDVAQDVATDAEQDRQFLEPIVEALTLVIDELERLQEEHKALKALVEDEIIGGVTNLYNQSVRQSGISELKGKYGEMFGPYEESWKAMSEDPNADLYEKLYDLVDELKKGPDYSDELEHNTMNEVLEKMKGSLKPAVSVEVEKSVEAPVEVDPLAKIKAMKKRAGNVSF